MPLYTNYSGVTRMKIYISADMEGATGVVRAEQTRSTDQEYSFGKAMQTHDLLAAIEGAFDGGADEVLINDSHARMINISPEDMPGSEGRLRIISGTPKQLGMMEGIKGCDGAFFLCYHAMAGTSEAVLDHTISGKAVYRAVLNGRESGETGLNAAVCGYFGVPVALITGDDATAREAKGLLGDSLLTCEVKSGISHAAASCLPPETTFGMIRERASEAVRRISQGLAPVPDTGNGDFCLDLTFHYTSQADCAEVPGTIRLDGRTVRIEGKGMDTMRRWAGSLISLGGSVGF